MMVSINISSKVHTCDTQSTSLLLRLSTESPLRNCVRCMSPCTQIETAGKADSLWEETNWRNIAIKTTMKSLQVLTLPLLTSHIDVRVHVLHRITGSFLLRFCDGITLHITRITSLVRSCWKLVIEKNQIQDLVLLFLPCFALDVTLDGVTCRCNITQSLSLCVYNTVILWNLTRYITIT